MESILEKLKLELAESKQKPGVCYSDEERSFYDGISIGLEKAIDMIEEEILNIKTLYKSLKDPDDNAFIEKLKTKLKN